MELSGGQQQKLESERKHHHRVPFGGGFEKDKGIKFTKPFGV